MLPIDDAIDGRFSDAPGCASWNRFMVLIASLMGTSVAPRSADGHVLPQRRSELNCREYGEGKIR